MKTIKEAFRRGGDAVRSVSGDVLGGLASSIIYIHLTSAVAPG